MNIEEIGGVTFINGFRIDEYTDEGLYRIMTFLRKVLKEVGDNSIN